MRDAVWTDPDATIPPIQARDYFAGLTPEQRAWCVRRVAELQALDPKTGDRLRRRRVTLRENVLAGRVGNSKWGWSMWGKSGRAWQEKHGVAYHFTAADHQKAKEARALNRALRKQGRVV